MLIAEEQMRIAKAESEEWIVQLPGNPRAAVDFDRDLYMVWHGVKSFAERLTDVRGLAKDNLYTCMHLVKFCAQEFMEFDFTKGQLRDNPNSPSSKLLQCLTVENIQAIGHSIAKMSPKERGRAIGRMVAETVCVSLAFRGVSATMKLTRSLANLHAEGKLAQSIEQTAQSFTSKIKNVLPAAEEVVAVTAEGVPVRVSTAAEETISLQNTTQKLGDAAKEVAKDAKEVVEWTAHRYKHKPPNDMSWKNIVKSTRHGEAFYKPGINIKELELHAWKYGQKTTNGKNWKVFKSDEIIGAKLGKETCYMRIECSANTIHGHPIPIEEYLELLK